LIGSDFLLDHGVDAGEIFVHHHDVGVNEAFDQSGGESVAFDINAGFVADFAIIQVEFKVADEGAVVGKDEVFGNAWAFLG
jgi:hypothetical protein